MLLGNGLLPMFAVAGGGGLTGATWALDGSGRAYNVPTLGSELLTDGGLENWLSSSNATNWSEATAGSSTVSQESALQRSGSNAARLNIDSGNSSANISQSFPAVVETWYQCVAFARGLAGTPQARLQFGNFSITTSDRTLSTTYQEIQATGRSTAVSVGFTLNRLSAASNSIIYDDASAKNIVFFTTLATVTGTTPTQTAAAKIHTLTTGTQAGVGALLDSASNPQNGLFAYHDGTGVTLDKVVNGTWTNLVPRVTVAFSSLAQTEVRPLGSNQFDLYYNGVKRGTTVTVSDASIINNTIYGLFSTYSGNLFTEFTLDGSVIPFGF